MITSFQARRNVFARLCLEGRSCGSVQSNRDETGEFVIVLDNLVLVAWLTIACEQALTFYDIPQMKSLLAGKVDDKTTGEHSFASELDRE